MFANFIEFIGNAALTLFPVILGMLGHISAL